jgi:hypothetical protein
MGITPGLLVVPRYVHTSTPPTGSGRESEGENFRDLAMNNKLMFVALGYVVLLAVLGFVLDLSIAAMIVS